MTNIKFDFRLILMKEKILILTISIISIFCSGKIEEKRLEGSFYTNDSGSAKGGFEWAGEYKASIEIVDGVGTLYLQQISGLGDPLSEHSLNVEDFKMDDSKIEMKINGFKAILLWTEKDRIWDGKYNFHYIGNNSEVISERIGSLNPASFPGLPEHYYVELRLKR